MPIAQACQTHVSTITTIAQEFAAVEVSRGRTADRDGAALPCGQARIAQCRLVQWTVIHHGSCLSDLVILSHRGTRP